MSWSLFIKLKLISEAMATKKKSDFCLFVCLFFKARLIESESLVGHGACELTFLKASLVIIMCKLYISTGYEGL